MPYAMMPLSLFMVNIVDTVYTWDACVIFRAVFGVGRVICYMYIFLAVGFL